MMDLLGPLIEKSREAVDTSKAIRGEDGRLRCAVCGEELEYSLPDGKIVNVPCACIREKQEYESSMKKLRDAVAAAHRALQDLGPFYDPAYERFTFQADRWPEKPASQLARSYAKRFAEMRKEGLGLLFSGPVGTGKSYLAAAIINELRERQGYRTAILSTARLISGSRSAREPQTLLDTLGNFDLVALDDLGAERTTDYGLEVLENFVDARALRRLPLLVTTNMTGKELSAPSDLRYARLFDRIRELCPKIAVLTGASLRGERQRKQLARMDELLGDDR